MYEKLRFSMNGCMYFLMWSMFNFNVTCGLCPAVFNGGYIDPKCTRETSCNVYCNPGFDKKYDRLFCVNGELWFPNPSSVCIKPVTCPAIFNDGYIIPTCSRLPGNACTFNCNPGFVTKEKQLTCGTDGMWIQDTNSICIKSNPCPAVFNGGYLDPSCSRLPGYFCTFYCNPEFVKRGSCLTCGNNGTWIQDTNSICVKADTCPAVFNDGYVESSCSRRPGDSCTFYCIPGFVKKGNLLTCGNYGNWITDTNSICIQSDTCAAAFNDGYVEPSCSRRPGDSCTFYCNPGFVKKGNLLTCGNYGNWIPDTNSICIQSDTCPDVFNGGYIEPFCSRRPGDSCTFYCYQEFVKKGYWLTCGNNGTWIQDTNSVCIKSVEQTTSYNEPRRTGQANVGTIVGITTAAFFIVMIIIVSIVVWRAKRCSVRKSQRVPGHAGETCMRPRQIRDQNVRTLRQQPDADGINSVSSFDSPTYIGIYDHSFEQRIPTISSSWKYLEPPPSYSETQIATKEAPPTYIEVVTDPTRFNLYI